MQNLIKLRLRVPKHVRTRYTSDRFQPAPATSGKTRTDRWNQDTPEKKFDREKFTIELENREEDFRNYANKEQEIWTGEGDPPQEEEIVMENIDPWGNPFTELKGLPFNQNSLAEDPEEYKEYVAKGTYYKPWYMPLRPIKPDYTEVERAFRRHEGMVMSSKSQVDDEFKQRYRYDTSAMDLDEQNVLANVVHSKQGSYFDAGIKETNRAPKGLSVARTDYLSSVSNMHEAINQGRRPSKAKPSVEKTEIILRNSKMQLNKGKLVPNIFNGSKRDMMQVTMELLRDASTRSQPPYFPARILEAHAQMFIVAVGPKLGKMFARSFFVNRFRDDWDLSKYIGTKIYVEVAAFDNITEEVTFRHNTLPVDLLLPEFAKSARHDLQQDHYDESEDHWVVDGEDSSIDDASSWE